MEVDEYGGVNRAFTNFLFFLFRFVYFLFGRERERERRGGRRGGELAYVYAFPFCFLFLILRQRGGKEMFFASSVFLLGLRRSALFRERGGSEGSGWFKDLLLLFVLTIIYTFCTLEIESHSEYSISPGALGQ